MQFSDEGYIIKMLKYGESSLILTVLTRNNGKIIGSIKNALNKNNILIYQLGNSLNLNVYARLEEGLYTIHADLLKANAVNFMFDEKKLYALSSLCELCNACLPEKENIESFYNVIEDFFNHIHEEDWLSYYSYFEFYLLEYLGVGLDLSECAVTGQKSGLKYVSPKSGKAVSAEAGAPYAERLFAYPEYILQKNYHPKLQEVDNLLKMTEFFLNKNFFRQHGLKFPQNRANLRNKMLNL